MSVSSLTSSSQSQLQSLFAKVDTDKSGTVTSEELLTAASDNSNASDALSALSDLVSTADADGDGTLAGSEFESAFNQLSSDMQSTLMSIQEGTSSGPSFSDLDSDSSDSLSFEEFSAGAPDDLANTEALQQLYSSIDTDDDGSVSQNEFSAFTDSASSASSATSTESTSSAGGTTASSGSSSTGDSSSSNEIESETTVYNADGSTTTTVTYTDGTSTTTTTKPSPTSAAARRNEGDNATQAAQGNPAIGAAISAYEAVQSAGADTTTSLDVAA